MLLFQYCFFFAAPFLFAKAVLTKAKSSRWGTYVFRIKGKTCENSLNGGSSADAWATISYKPVDHFNRTEQYSYFSSCSDLVLTLESKDIVLSESGDSLTYAGNVYKFETLPKAQLDQNARIEKEQKNLIIKSKNFGGLVQTDRGQPVEPIAESKSSAYDSK